MDQVKLNGRRFALLLLLVFLGTVAFLGSRQETAVRSKTPAQTLDQPMSEAQKLAQDVALADTAVQTLTLGQRSEVFGVREVGQQVTEASEGCLRVLCQQVEIYNFESNSTVLAIVDVEARMVLDVLEMPNLQPGINQRLADKAIEIAISDPDVFAELGFKPSADDLDMAPVAAGVRDSSCDQLLCAAPTFRVGNRVLWAIVDLTNETLHSLNWTEVKSDGRSQHIAAFGGCPASGTIDRLGWQMTYETTGTDGLAILNATFNSQEIIRNAKVVEWHVDYEGTYQFAGFLDVTGCGGGGGGFFIFPFGETQILDLVEDGSVVGFEVVQDFRMDDWGQACHYRYEQRMQFFADGRFRPVTGIYGRGCGPFPVYRPVQRIDLALDPTGKSQVGYWDGKRWQQPANEFLLSPDPATFGPAGHPVTDNNAMLWVMNQQGAGYYMIPNAGQFHPTERGDEPFVYLTQYDDAEGATDLPIFSGLCCENDFQQGPHFFVDGDSIQNTNVVLWYVSQHETEVNATDSNQNYCWTVSGEPDPETYPCFGGPMFVPFGFEGSSITAAFTVDEPTIDFPEEATFTNQSVITGNIPVNYVWEFGDGKTAVEENPTHRYLQPGPFVPQLTVDAFLNGTDSVLGTAVQITVINRFLPHIDKSD